jgi:hypothetical protein
VRVRFSCAKSCEMSSMQQPENIIGTGCLTACAVNCTALHKVQYAQYILSVSCPNLRIKTQKEAFSKTQVKAYTTLSGCCVQLQLQLFSLYQMELLNFI